MITTKGTNVPNSIPLHQTFNMIFDDLELQKLETVGGNPSLTMIVTILSSYHISIYNTYEQTWSVPDEIFLYCLAKYINRRYPNSLKDFEPIRFLSALLEDDEYELSMIKVT